MVCVYDLFALGRKVLNEIFAVVFVLFVLMFDNFESHNIRGEFCGGSFAFVLYLSAVT